MAPDVVPGERDVLPWNVVSVRMTGHIYGEAGGFNDALLGHRALGEVNESIRAEDRSTWLMPTAIRQLVEEHCSFAGFRIDLQKTRGITAFGHCVNKAVPGAQSTKSTLLLDSEHIDLAVRCQSQEAGGQPRPCGPGRTAFRDESCSVFSNRQPAREGQAG